MIEEEIKKDEISIVFVGLIVVPEVESIMHQVENAAGHEVNYTVMTEDEFSYRKKSNDPFIWKFLRQPKIMLVGTEEELVK